MHIIEILEMRKLDISKKIKLVRHQDKNFDLFKMYSEGKLETYQRIQSKDVFNGCEYIVSFLGYENTKAKFIGVYRVLKTDKVSKVNLPQDCVYEKDEIRDYFYYDLNPVSGFDDLKDRVVIEWGIATRSWHQWLTEKNIVSILPDGYLKNFPGYHKFTLSFDELATIINNKEANEEWHTMLKAVAGIYLILDTVDGLQYIGSAYGSEGILGRWKNYVSTKDGGNKRLKDLIQKDPDRYKSFQFTILHTLSKTLTKKEVIGFEKEFKEKLGSKSFGLNDN